MNFGLLLVGVGLLAFPGLISSRAGRFPSSEWARVAILTFGLGALCVFAGLLMTMLPPVLHLLALGGLRGICDPVVHSLMIGGELVGWIAAALVVTITAAAMQAVRRSRRAARVAHIEPWLGTHTAENGYELVVVPTPALIALGVPGATPQIVVSQGLVDELDDERLEAVVGHELGHLELHHRRVLVVVGVIERSLGVLPFVRRSATAVRHSLEVWADDFAVGMSRVTERTLHGALVAVGMTGAQQSADAVATRARRLVEPAPCLSTPVRSLTYLPAGGLLCGAAALAVGWALTSHQMLSLGGYC